MEIEITPENIRKYREKLNMSQEEMARDLGVAFATVNRWENEGRGMKQGLTKYALKKYFEEKFGIDCKKD